MSHMSVFNLFPICSTLPNWLKLQMNILHSIVLQTEFSFSLVHRINLIELKTVKNDKFENEKWLLKVQRKQVGKPHNDNK